MRGPRTKVDLSGRSQCDDVWVLDDESDGEGSLV